MSSVVKGATSFVGDVVSSFTDPIFGVDDAAKQAKRAASATAKNTQLGIDSQERMFDKSLEYVDPYHNLATQNLPYLQNLLNGGGKTFNFQSSPSYLWQLEQGEDAIKRMQASIGGLNSSATGNLLMDFNRGLAAQEVDKNWGRLLDLTKIGQMSAGQAGASSMQTGNTLASLYQNQGRALSDNFMQRGGLATMYSPGNIGMGIGSMFV